MRDFLSAVYFTVVVPYPSLFFFRSRHLFETLTILSKDETYLREKNFWQKSEDLILRSKGQFSTKQLVEIIKIYNEVPVSRVFWNEMEQLLLSKSADFRGHKDFLVPIVGAFANRCKETFLKVFSGQVNNISSELSFDEFVIVLDALDHANGSALFQLFGNKYFIEQQFKFVDNLEQVLALARIFIKHDVRPPVANQSNSDLHHPALLSELFGIMMKYFSL